MKTAAESYFTCQCSRNETPVVCSEESEGDLIGQKLEKFSSVVKKYCSDISLEKEIEEEEEVEEV